MVKALDPSSLSADNPYVWNVINNAETVKAALRESQLLRYEDTVSAERAQGTSQLVVSRCVQSFR